MNTSTLEEARSAKKQVLRMLEGMPELAGVGIARAGSGYGVKVNLSAPPARDAALPETVDGVPVRVEIVGVISKQGTGL